MPRGAFTRSSLFLPCETRCRHGFVKTPNQSQQAAVIQTILPHTAEPCQGREARKRVSSIVEFADRIGDSLDERLTQTDSGRSRFAIAAEIPEKLCSRSMAAKQFAAQSYPSRSIFAVFSPSFCAALNSHTRFCNDAEAFGNKIVPISIFRLRFWIKKVQEKV